MMPSQKTLLKVAKKKNSKTTPYESRVQSNTRAERKKTDKLQPEVRQYVFSAGGLL